MGNERTHCLTPCQTLWDKLGGEPSWPSTWKGFLWGASLALGLALQPGHGLFQVLHNEVHLGPGGAAAHAEPERVPGHVEGNTTAQQHWGWPGGW